MRILTDALSSVATDLAHREAQEMVERVLHCTPQELFLHTTLSADQQDQLSLWCTERMTGRPLAYVIGKTYFYNSDLFVSEATLIPRHDTEILVSQILATLPDETCHFLELGTGTGCIPKALVLERPLWTGITVDISEAALAVARRNLPPSVTPLLSNRFSEVPAQNQFRAIISNPPYIPTLVVKEELEPSVREHEPHTALDGGNDGLDFYRYLIEKAPLYLNENGYMFVEIGSDQGESVPALFHQDRWHQIMCVPDLAGRPRAVQAQLRI